MNTFKLKANFFPITVIKFFRCDQRSIVQQLKGITQTAPNYFRQSPVVIDLAELKRPSKGVDLAKLVQLLKEYQMVPVGIQGISLEETVQAQELGLAVWQAQKTIEPINPQVSPPNFSNTLITKPVRSGMRIYAKQSNLVLMAPVHSGAECIADGYIFCYAPVQGRLLAGASGDLEAQIFCHSLEAELIAIAGYYLVYDEFPNEKNGFFQIFLKENRLHVNSLSVSNHKGVLSV